MKSAHGCALGAWFPQAGGCGGKLGPQRALGTPHHSHANKRQGALGGSLRAGRFEPRSPCQRALRVRFNHSANSTASVAY